MALLNWPSIKSVIKKLINFLRHPASHSKLVNGTERQAIEGKSLKRVDRIRSAHNHKPIADKSLQNKTDLLVSLNAIAFLRQFLELSTLT